VLNASLHVWPLASALGQSLSGIALRGLLGFPELKLDGPAGVGLGSPGQAMGDTSTSSTLDANNTASNATALPLPVPGVDSLPLLYARAGLLPLASPAHFEIVQIASLYQVLPSGMTLDLEYDPTDATSTLPALQPVSTAPTGAETSLWLKAFSAVYQPPPRANHNSTSTAAASSLLWHSERLPILALLAVIGWMLL
jgi:hypothetical protein